MFDEIKIPINLLNKSKINPGDKAQWIMINDEIILMKIEDLTGEYMKGRYITKEPINSVKLRKNLKEVKKYNWS